MNRPLLVRIFSVALARYKTPDANQGCTLFDGGLEIVAHSHAELGERQPRPAPEILRDVMQMTEAAPRLVQVTTGRADGHEALPVETRKRRQSFNEWGSFLRGDAVLGGFAGGVYF